MLYFDVHGTLFEYDYSLYTQQPCWYADGVHPFANDTPLGNMPEAVRQLLEKGIPMQTLCRISKGSSVAQAEQIEDVNKNLELFYSWLSKTAYGYCSGDKSKELGRPLTKSDILLDDYPPNLIEWEKAGGTSVKVLNGINSLKTWYGYFIDASWPPEATVRRILSIMCEINRRLE